MFPAKEVQGFLFAFTEMGYLQAFVGRARKAEDSVEGKMIVKRLDLLCILA